MAIAGSERKMSLGTQHDRRSPNSAHRPPVVSSHSNSLPSTPRQRPRDHTHRSRSPSPNAGPTQPSPRSVSSESNRAMASLRPTNPYCRFQSTQTSRRRVAYTIGADMLEPDPEQRRRHLGQSQQFRLDEDADQLYNRLLPSPDSREKRLRVVDKLKGIIHREWPESNARVVVFGSSGNLLCTSKSDGSLRAPFKTG